LTERHLKIAGKWGSGPKSPSKKEKSSERPRGKEELSSMLAGGIAFSENAPEEPISGDKRKLGQIERGRGTKDGGHQIVVLAGGERKEITNKRPVVEKEINREGNLTLQKEKYPRLRWYKGGN